MEQGLPPDEDSGAAGWVVISPVPDPAEIVSARVVVRRYLTSGGHPVMT